MLPYILVALFLLFLAIHFDVKGRVKKKDQYITIATWVLIFFSGLRNELGIDTFAYSYTYETVPKLSDLIAGKVDLSNLQAQPLWLLFMSVCKTISNHFVFMQMIVALVFNYLIVRFFKNVTDKVFICLLIFFCTKWYVYNFEVLRESICVVLFLNGLVVYFKTHSTRRLLLYCIPAVFIHWFALIIIIILVIVNKSNWNVLLWSSVILTLLLLFISNSEVDTFLNSTLVLLDSSNEKLVDYVNKIYDSSFNMNFYLQLSITCFIPVILLIRYYYEDVKKSSQITSMLIKYLPVYLVFGAFTSHLVIAYRLSNYIYPIFLVLAVNALSNVYLNKRYMLKVRTRPRGNVVMLLFLFCFTITTYLDIKTFLLPSDSKHDKGSLDIRYFPYTTIFQEPNDERTQSYLYWRDWQ